MSLPALDYDEQVGQLFDSTAAYWADIYESATVAGEFYRDRMAAVLRWVDRLNLPAGSRVVEVGCGAGRLSVALAERGHRIDAVDASEEMIRLTMRHASERHIGALVSPATGDINSLPFQDGTYDLAITVGVISWVSDSDRALRELARVMKPGGHMIVTVNNSIRLDCLFDPRRSPLLLPFRARLKRLLEQMGCPKHSVQPNFLTGSSLERTLARLSFRMVDKMTRGFGPFTFWGRTMFPEAVGVRLQRVLQYLADRNAPVLRATGGNYFVLATKHAVWARGCQ